MSNGTHDGEAVTLPVHRTVVTAAELQWSYRLGWHMSRSSVTVFTIRLGRALVVDLFYACTSGRTRCGGRLIPDGRNATGTPLRISPAARRMLLAADDERFPGALQPMRNIGGTSSRPSIPTPESDGSVSSVRPHGRSRSTGHTRVPPTSNQGKYSSDSNRHQPGKVPVRTM
jgi:hypothetical protein